MRGKKADRDHRQHVIDAADGMHQAVRDAVRIADADMGRGERGGESKDEGEQRFHEGLCSEPR